MTLRQNAATFLGNPLTLHGQPLEVGQKAPAFTLVGSGLAPVSLDDFQDKIKVIMTVPSLDTQVCDFATRRFNTEATTLGEDVMVLVVSMDLPFAQERWCGAAGIDNVVTLSDYQTAQFGKDYGVLIDGLRLLARGIIVLDQNNNVTYTEYVSELSDQVNFEGALQAVKSLTVA